MTEPEPSPRRLRSLAILLLLGAVLAHGALAGDPPPPRPSMAPT